ncbi:MAG TPA: hypothetical protein VGR92_16460 [Steroidobacteraceae bacterium]|nr:hypothetical protein [Steroidobacteraceae bacterium]
MQSPRGQLTTASRMLLGALAADLNLFNKEPPVDVETYGGGSGFYPYDPGLHQAGAVGRYFTLGAAYEF